MARRRTDPSILIARFEDVLKDAKPREIVNADGLAAALGMTWRNVKVTYIDPDPKFPIKTVGAEGKAYAFVLPVVLKYLIRKLSDERAEIEERQARKADRLGIAIPDELSGASIEIIGRHIDLSLKVQKEKRQQQGEVDPDDAAMFLAGLFQTIRDEIMGAAPVADPTAALPPEVRARIDDHMRDLCLAVEARIGAFIEEYRANTDAPGAGPGD